MRLTHWLVALCVLVNFFNDTGFWHRMIGYGCLMLVLIRLVDGLWISKNPASKFYLPQFSAIKTHLKELRSGIVSFHIGHNPLGQIAVYCIWLLIFLLALTGWISRTDAYWGEDWPVEVHTMLSTALKVMVVLHVLAVLLMSKLQQKNLVKAITIGK